MHTERGKGGEQRAERWVREGGTGAMGHTECVSADAITGEEVEEREENVSHIPKKKHYNSHTGMHVLTDEKHKKQALNSNTTNKTLTPLHKKSHILEFTASPSHGVSHAGVEIPVRLLMQSAELL